MSEPLKQPGFRNLAMIVVTDLRRGMESPGALELLEVYSPIMIVIGSLDEECRFLLAEPPCSEISKYVVLRYSTIHITIDRVEGCASIGVCSIKADLGHFRHCGQLNRSPL